jgi:hypothetical protein
VALIDWLRPKAALGSTWSEIAKPAAKMVWELFTNDRSGTIGELRSSGII